jgi:cold shock CspA family protein
MRPAQDSSPERLGDANIEYGQIIWFDDRLGYGCLRTGDDRRIYLHYKDIDAQGHRTVVEDEIVSFVREQTRDGLRARRVRRVGLSEPPWKQAFPRIVRAFLRFLNSRSCTRYIWVLRDGIPSVNLVRYYVAVTRKFEIYVHQFMDDDDPVLHDHPWPFVSVLLSGGYTEHDMTGGAHHRIRGSVIVRGRGFFHRVTVAPINRGRTLTLIITGPRTASWNFYDSEQKRLVAPEEYGQSRGASVLLFNQLSLRGVIFPRIENGKVMPRLGRSGNS